MTATTLNYDVSFNDLRWLQSHMVARVARRTRRRTIFMFLAIFAVVVLVPVVSWLLEQPFISVVPHTPGAPLPSSPSPGDLLVPELLTALMGLPALALLLLIPLFLFGRVSLRKQIADDSPLLGGTHWKSQTMD